MAITRRWITPLLLGLAWVALLLIWLYLLHRRAEGLPVPDFVEDPKTCNCLMGRFMALLNTPGDRDQLLATAWRMFVEHPILGAGPGSFMGSISTYNYPHNVPLEIAAETGLAGLAILLGPLVVGMARLVSVGVRAASSGVASLVAVIVVFAVVSNLSGDLPSARALWIFGVVALKLGFAPADAAVDDLERDAQLQDGLHTDVANAPTRMRGPRIWGISMSAPVAVGVTTLLLIGTIAGTTIALIGDRSAPPCESASFSATPDRARAGDVVRFVPAAFCGGEPAEFRWYVRAPGESGWALVQNWSTGDFFWNTAGLGAGLAGIDMYARRVGRPSSEIDVARDYVLDP